MKKLMSVLACASMMVQPNVAEARPASATYYGDGFHGRRMANGRAFSQQRMTAAHPTLPLGSKLKVVNPKTGKSVFVTITDRCGGCSLDLSKAAFRQLGSLGRGRMPVRIHRVK
jgi:rare lipoprotein A